MEIEELKAAWGNPNALYAAWVVTLESGKYIKSRGRMHDSGCYCALGLLCHVAKVEPTTIELPKPLARFLDITVSAAFINPVTVLTSIVPRREFEAYDLMVLNDDTDWTLMQIGRYLNDNRWNLRHYPQQ